MSALPNLLTVFLVIAVGAVLRGTGFIAREDWRGFERITYFVLFPAMLMVTMATADLASTPFLAVGGTLVLSLLTVATIMLALRPLLLRWFALDGPSFSSVFQGSIRWNSFVAFAMASSLYGKQGAALCAVAIAAMIPLLNVLSPIFSDSNQKPVHLVVLDRPRASPVYEFYPQPRDSPRNHDRPDIAGCGVIGRWWWS